VGAGEPLITLHADTESEISYAIDYVRSAGHGIRIEA
jgi:hypothetical protein